MCLCYNLSWMIDSLLRFSLIKNSCCLTKLNFFRPGEVLPTNITSDGEQQVFSEMKLRTTFETIWGECIEQIKCFITWFHQIMKGVQWKATVIKWQFIEWKKLDRLPIKNIFSYSFITNDPLLFSNNYFLTPSFQISKRSSFFHSMNHHFKGFVLFG